MHCEDNNFDAGDGNAGELCGFAVAADGERVAAENRAMQQKSKNDEASDHDPDGRLEIENRLRAETRKRDVRDADGFSVAADRRDTTGDLHGGEGDNECIDSKLRDDEAVDETDDAAGCDTREDGEKRAVMMAFDDGCHHASQRGDGTDRKIKISRRQAEEYQAADNSNRGDGCAARLSKFRWVKK